MHSRLLRKCTYLAAAALLALVLVPPTTAKAKTMADASGPAQTAFSGQASMLLQQVQRDAWAVREETDELGTYARDTEHPSEELGYQSEAELLTRIRGRVNAMDGALRQLRTHQDQLLTWQRQAVHRVAPDVLDLTINTQAAIVSLNKNREHLFTAPLGVYSENMYTLSKHINQSVEDFDQYASARHELQHLRQALHLPS